MLNHRGHGEKPQRFTEKSNSVFSVCISLCDLCVKNLRRMLNHRVHREKPQRFTEKSNSVFSVCIFLCDLCVKKYFTQHQLLVTISFYI